MTSSIIDQIAEQENLSILTHTPLHGGDINEVYHCTTVTRDIVIKVNRAEHFPGMFRKETNGLAELRKSGPFIVPDVIGQGSVAGLAYLLLDYLPTQPPPDWAAFGTQLARLHQTTTDQFGFYESNYIGNLVQFNDPVADANTFYIQRRLEPQFRLAMDKGYRFNQLEQLYKEVEQLVPDEAPALIHGDLWNGNYLATPSGFALIDPAVSYGIREMDLAMMRLFGGFPAVVFAAYAESFPLVAGWRERLELWQLYYILVHVNLFGGAYVGQAKKIIRHYAGTG